MEIKDVMEVSWITLLSISEIEVFSLKTNTHTKLLLDHVKRIQEALKFQDSLILKVAVNWQEPSQEDLFQ